MKAWEWLSAIVSFAAVMVSGASVARAQESFSGMLRARREGRVRRP